MFSRFRHSLLFGLFLIFLQTVVPVAQAQNLTPPIIAVIDINGVERKSIAWESLRTQVESQREAYQKDLSAREKELEAEGRELQAQQTLLDPKVLKERDTALRQNVAELRKEAQGKKKLLDKSYAAARRQIRDALVVVVTEIAKEQGLNLILNMSRQDQTVAYADLRLNISNEALERLNLKIQAVSLSAE